MGRKLTITGAILCSLISSALFAQTQSNYFRDVTGPKYGVLFNLGLAVPYTDVTVMRKANLMGGVSGVFRPAYFIDVVLGFQLGALRSGDNSDANALYFKNQMFDAVATARIYPLRFLNNNKYNSPLYYASGIYGGAGVGLLKSKVNANIVKPASGFEYMGNYSGTDVVLPAEIGFTLPLTPVKKNQQLFVNINYRFNFVLEDKIDGYITPAAVNARNDVYNTITVGLGYSF